MIKVKLSAALALVVFAGTVMAQQGVPEKYSAVLYDLKSGQTKKLYTLNIDVTPSPEGNRSQTTYRDLQGNVVVQESGLAVGDELKEYSIDRPQTGEKGKIEVRDGKVFFEYQDADGKKKTADERVKGRILTAANFTAFVRANWEVLMAGKVIPVRYAVWDRRETVGFDLQKVGEPDIKGQKAMEVRMKPSSFLIAALVDPVHLFYNQSSKSLMLMKGRVPVKQKVDGKWKDLDTETVYTMDQPSVSK